MSRAATVDDPDGTFNHLVAVQREPTSATEPLTSASKPVQHGVDSGRRRFGGEIEALAIVQHLRVDLEKHTAEISRLRCSPPDNLRK